MTGILNNMDRDFNSWGKENFEILRGLFQKATSVEFSDDIVSPSTIQFKTISQDDLTNLKIDLNNITGPDDFLRRM